MATKTNFDYFGGGTVTSNDTLYEVNMRGYNFFVNRKAVETVLSDNVKEKPHTIAALLAYIKYAKLVSEDKKAEEVTNKQLVYGVSELLQKYTSNELINILSNLKWSKVYKMLVPTVSQS